MTKKIYPFLEDAKRAAAGTKNEVYKLEDGSYYVGTYNGALKEKAKRGKFRKLKKQFYSGALAGVLFLIAPVIASF